MVSWIQTHPMECISIILGLIALAIWGLIPDQEEQLNDRWRIEREQEPWN